MNYWENRHKKYGVSLKSVGHIGLSDVQNLADYAAKEQQLRKALEWAFPANSGPMAIWDAGAGIGSFINIYHALSFPIVHASDLSADAIERVRVAYPYVATQVSTIQHAAWGRKFHAVVCMDVLYHILDDEEWRASLEVMRGHLLPGGFLIIQEHFVDAASRPNVHMRFRREQDYNAALGGQWVYRTEYRLPESNVALNLLVYQF